MSTSEATAKKIKHDVYNTAGIMLASTANDLEWSQNQRGAARLILRKFVFGLTHKEVDALFDHLNPKETIEEVRPIVQNIFANAAWRHRNTVSAQHISMPGMQSRAYEERINILNQEALSAVRVLASTHS